MLTDSGSKDIMPLKHPVRMPRFASSLEAKSFSHSHGDGLLPIRGCIKRLFSGTTDYNSDIVYFLVKLGINPSFHNINTLVHDLFDYLPIFHGSKVY